MIKNLKVYRGSNDNDRFEESVYFFSSEKVFSDVYGNVREYVITINHPFHTCEENDVTRLIEILGILYDPYNGDTFQVFADYESSEVFFHDTWEIFEQYIPEIKRLGFDGVIVFEGGIKNYICFDKKQLKGMNDFFTLKRKR